MIRVTDNQPARFVLRVTGRKPGQADNVRNYNCPTLQAMTLQLARLTASDDAHKVEVLAVLEVFVRE